MPHFSGYCECDNLQICDPNNKYFRLGPLRSEAAVQRMLEEDSVRGQRMLEVQSELEQLGGVGEGGKLPGL